MRPIGSRRRRLRIFSKHAGDSLGWLQPRRPPYRNARVQQRGTMSTRVMLTGMLPFVVIVASLLAIPVSLFLLRKYKRAVRRGMATGQSIIAAPDRAPRTTPAAALEVKTLPGDSVMQLDSMKPILRIASFARWRTAAVYAAAGACYAAIITGGVLLSDRTQAVVLVKLALLFWTFLWPVVPVAVLVAAYDRTRRVRSPGVRHARTADKLLEVLGNELRAVIGNDSRLNAGIPLFGPFQRLLFDYVRYHHDDRTHLGLGKGTPAGRICSANAGRVISHDRLGGLHHRYDRAA